MPQKENSKKKRNLDFRYYDLPQSESYLLFHGPGWRRNYGYDAQGKRIDSQHFHNCLEIGVCLKGKGILQYDCANVPYQENTVSVVPRNMVHNTLNEPGEYSEWIWLFVDEKACLSQLYPDNPQKASGVLRRVNCRPLCVKSEKDALFFKSCICTVLEEQENRDLYYKDEIQLVLQEILLRIGRENRSYYEQTRGSDQKGDGWKFSEALSYIDDHYQDPITVHDIASSAGLSESYFRTIFRNSMNTSPLEYLNMVRIQKVCSMLVHTDDTIENIAFKCGFETMSTFNRNFQKYLHEPPLKWRKAHQKDGLSASGMHVTVHRGWY